MRQYAWLTTTPEKANESRWEHFTKTEKDIEFPELFGLSHLFDYLSELGYALSSGMGLMPITFTEIKHWRDLMQVPLSIFEIDCLRNLSAVYVDQKNKSTEPGCPPPFFDEIEMTPEKRKVIDSFFKNLPGVKKE